MTLTLSDGPLGTNPPESTNYAIDGPPHRILFSDFPRRVRAVIDGEVVIDTTAGKLLHESNILPALYVPIEDVRMDLLEPTDHQTFCPFKGEAAYWSVRIEDRVEENAVWSYPDPFEQVAGLKDYLAFYTDRLSQEEAAS